MQLGVSTLQREENRFSGWGHVIRRRSVKAHFFNLTVCRWRTGKRRLRGPGGAARFQGRESVECNDCGRRARRWVKQTEAVRDWTAKMNQQPNESEYCQRWNPKEKNTVTRSFAFYGNLPPRGGNSSSDDDSSTHPDHDRNATITNQVKIKLQNKRR